MNAAPVLVDARMSFLLRASTKLLLVETGEAELAPAFFSLIGPFVEIVGPIFECETCLATEERKRRKPLPPKPPRPTPQATVEAIMHCVREHGVIALKLPANMERLSRCDARAKAEINKRIAALSAEKAGA